MNRQRWMSRFARVAGLAAIGLAFLGVIGFQDNLFRYWMDPHQPFQTMTPPPEPDYGEDGSWAYRGATPAEGEAAIFFVHPTTYWGGESWNAAIDHPESRARLDYAYLPNQAGPFTASGELWAPRYRQASLFSALTHRYDAQSARALAFEDVARAFDVFLAEAPEEGPIILAGVEQGALHVLGLLQDRAAEDELRSRIAAVYLIDHAVPLDLLRTLPDLPLCEARDETGCIVAWASALEDDGREIRRVRDRAMVWNEEGRLQPTEGRALACVNPLLGAATEDFVPRRQHLGGVDASGLEPGVDPAPLPAQTSVQCRDGVLLVDPPEAPSLRRRWSWGGRFKPNAANLFYADIRADVARRLEALAAEEVAEQLASGPQSAPPIDEFVVIEEAPINPVPE